MQHDCISGKSKAEQQIVRQVGLIGPVGLIASRITLHPADISLFLFDFQFTILVNDMEIRDLDRRNR